MDIRWHTEARQQPRIIGKDVSGKKIPGGPYTIYQVVGGLMILPIGLWTKPLWAPHTSTIAAWIILAAVTFTAVWLIGLIDWTWSPINTFIGWARTVTHATTSPAGTLAARGSAPTKIQARPPTRLACAPILYTTLPAPQTPDMPPPDPPAADDTVTDAAAQSIPLTPAETPTPAPPQGPRPDQFPDPDQPACPHEPEHAPNPPAPQVIADPPTTHDYPDEQPQRLSALEAFLAAANRS